MSHSAIYEIVGPSDEILRRYVHGYGILTILAMTTMKSFTRYYVIILRYYTIYEIQGNNNNEILCHIYEILSLLR